MELVTTLESESQSTRIVEVTTNNYITGDCDQIFNNKCNDEDLDLDLGNSLFKDNSELDNSLYKKDEICLTLLYNILTSKKICF